MMSGTQDNPIVISDDDDDEISREIVQKDSEEIITVAIADSSSDIAIPHIIDVVVVRVAIVCICVGVFYVIVMFLAFC